MLSGGGGLVSTAADYHAFTQMLLPRPDSPAGEHNGVRLLGPRTVAYMARNHLPGGVDLEKFGRPLYAETPFRGVGFGLGFAVVLDPARQGRLLARRAVLGRRGEHRVLARPGRGADGDVLHPADPLQRPPDPLPAPPARLPVPALTVSRQEPVRRHRAPADIVGFHAPGGRLGSGGRPGVRRAGHRHVRAGCLGRPPAGSPNWPVTAGHWSSPSAPGASPSHLLSAASVTGVELSRPMIDRLRTRREQRSPW